MKNKNRDKDETKTQNQEEVKEEKVVENKEETKTEGEEKKEEPKSLEEQLKEKDDKYLRLYAEYENYRRRTSQERINDLKMASAPLMKDLLPIIDDYERALESMNKEGDKNQYEGILLIYNKLMKTLKDKGLEEIDAKGKDFNTDEHEALTMLPGDESMKNKVVDVVTKGYKLNGTVIRFARVVVGA